MDIIHTNDEEDGSRNVYKEFHEMLKENKAKGLGAPIMREAPGTDKLDMDFTGNEMAQSKVFQNMMIAQQITPTQVA